MFWCRKHPYDVTLHLSGRHPYLRSRRFDLSTRDITVRVLAKSWNHAASVGLRAKPPSEQCWSWHVVAVARVS